MAYWFDPMWFPCTLCGARAQEPCVEVVRGECVGAVEGDTDVVHDG